MSEPNYVKMIISYDPEGKCIPQGLDVSEESKLSKEKEILLFPFTFLKIDNVEINSGTENDKHIIFLTIINRENTLEYGLNNNLSFQLINNGTKLVVDYFHDLKCDYNELYYNMYANEIENIKKENNDIKKNCDNVKCYC